MADSMAGETGQEQTRDDDRSAEADGFITLRTLVVGPERERIRSIQARLDDTRARTQEISQILADAIDLKKNDPELFRALAPAIERAIATSVRRNPKPLADALFPVIGPAIRKAIAHALQAMVQSLNKSLEQSLSVRALHWRVIAWRTGKPFSEVVLLNTLLYRVEQVFLIHQESGLLLLHATAPSVTAQDPDMISAMLTAIRDFVRDSFGSQDQESLEALRVGELTVWVEQGPHAILAALVRGTAPLTLRTGLQDALEAIHMQYDDELRSFSGDTQAFESARPIVETCLESQLVDRGQKRPSRPFWVVLSIAALLLMIWGGFYLRDSIRWNRYVERLKSEPGILVLSSRHFAITGLRDPLAADPRTVAREAKLIPEEIAARWEPYEALHPTLVLARARQILDPPETVELQLKEGRLMATGSAPRAWLTASRGIAPLIAGVARYDDSRLQDADLISMKQQVESFSLRFVKGTDRLVPGQEASIEAIIEKVRRLDEAARDSRSRARLEIVGHTDSDGIPESNLALSRARAAFIRDLLRARGAVSLEIQIMGAGSSKPLVRATTEDEKQTNRRVAFRVMLGEASGEKAPPP